MADTDLPPRFFKVFVSHFSSDSMLIPLSYYDELPRRLPKTVILQGSGGGFWNVTMKNKQDEVFLGQGWAKFVRDNFLSDGDLLTFVYNGDRIFEVSIYGQDGCKEIRAVTEVEDDKEDSVCSLSSDDTNTCSESEMANTIPRNKNKGKKKEEVVKSSDEDSDSDYTDAFGRLDFEENFNSDSSYSPDSKDAATFVKPKVTNPNKKGKFKLIDDVDGISDSSKPKLSRKKREKLKTKIKNPEAYLDDPKNLHFETNVKNRKYELLVHAQLVKDYCLNFQDHIEYIDDIGRVEAKTVKWTDQRVCIKQWNYICNRNKLKKSDRILCELFRKQNLVYAIKIHIIRERYL